MASVSVHFNKTKASLEEAKHSDWSGAGSIGTRLISTPDRISWSWTDSLPKVITSTIFFVHFPADDMGLGKTLTMIALILTQKNQKKSEEKDETMALTWLSKNGIPKCLASLLLPKWREAVESGSFSAMKGCLWSYLIFGETVTFLYYHFWHWIC